MVGYFAIISAVDKQIGLTMKEQDLIKKLKGHIYSEYGSARAFAREVGLSNTYISQVLNGDKPLTDTILAHVGFKKVVTIDYVKA
jgi:transcriptional regulator with XRE-family HTH domain